MIWVERIDGMSRFEEMSRAVIQTWKEMELNETNYNSNTSSNAESLHSCCMKFSFVLALVVARECFYRMRGATFKLQSRSHNDIIKGHSIIKDVVATLKEVRSNIEEYHHLWFARANALSMEVNGKFDDPRLCASETLRNNQPLNS